MKIQISKRVQVSGLLLTILNFLFLVHQVLTEANYVLFGALFFVFQFLILSVFFIPNAYFYEIKNWLSTALENQADLNRRIQRLSEREEQSRELVLESIAKLEEFAEDSKAESEKNTKEISRQQAATQESVGRINKSIDAGFAEVTKGVSGLTDGQTTTQESIGRINKSIDAGFAEVTKGVSGLTDGLKTTQESIGQISKSIDDGFGEVKKGILGVADSHQITAHELIRQIGELIDEGLGRSNEEVRSLADAQKAAKESIGQISKSIDDGFEGVKDNVQGVADSQRAVQETLAQISELTNRELGALNVKLDKYGADLETQVKRQLETTYSRLDALISLHEYFDFNHPLPVMNQWAISADYALELVYAVLDKSTGSVIDIGSGISTILMGYAIQIQGSGKVISLEHSEEFYEQTKKLIVEHGLEDICELHLCPLKTHVINGEDWVWYDIDKVNFDEDIAVISVDGPPGHIQELARYPAIPVLYRFINEKTEVFLDDGKRRDEMAIARRWEKDYKLKSQKHHSHKGLFKFSKV